MNPFDVLKLRKGGNFISKEQTLATMLNSLAHWSPPVTLEVKIYVVIKGYSDKVFIEKLGDGQESQNFPYRQDNCEDN
jgi:hypothetical protein